MSLAPVARTVRTLVDKGLLARVANPKSRRADLITVTVQGQAILNKDPRRLIADVIGNITADQRESLALGMEALVLTLLAEVYTERPSEDDVTHLPPTEPSP